MPAMTNPYELSREVENRYRDYLTTMFYFKDPTLRASFDEALLRGGLSKGPYLEATPIFKHGLPPRELFHELLGSQPEESFLAAFAPDRPLYDHQERAIRGVLHGHNVVVATGTGSGKTEAFLYSIFLHLYEEHKAGTLGPGVRALILYPMNALVNDQRERLGDIARSLHDAERTFNFTFGQYVGETPADANDRFRNGRGAVEKREQDGFSRVQEGLVQHGEMVLREEMRSTPPHILLTNFSMLEYLMLRPDDSPLFDGGRATTWSFFVLDEAHQYRGAQGMEMALLLRRLKQRLRDGGRTEPIRCIATSATLLGGDDSTTTPNAQGATFAADLFGEPFTEDGIITGTTTEPPHPGPHALQAGDYAQLIAAEDTNTQRHTVAELADKLGLPDPAELVLPPGR